LKLKEFKKDFPPFERKEMPVLNCKASNYKKWALRVPRKESINNEIRFFFLLSDACLLSAEKRREAYSQQKTILSRGNVLLWK
jgi:hypothetical protein